MQEEPRNRGAWYFMREMFDRSFPRLSLGYIGREESASPATGSHSRHEREQRQIVEAAFAPGASVIGENPSPPPEPPRPVARAASATAKVRSRK